MSQPTYHRFRELMGRTPMIDLSHLQNNPEIQIVAKCELINPGFSIKDRIIAHIFDVAERSGQLKPGGRVLAASSGNTGAAVAMMAAQRGYHAIIVTSPKCSQEKMDAIRAYGAELIVADGSDGSYQDVALHMAAEDPDLFDVDQYANPLNPEAHYLGIGPEIWEDTAGRVTHFICGASTGGTICGVSRYLKEQNPNVRVIMADPVGSIFHEYFETGCHGEPDPFQVEGVGKSNIPETMSFDCIDDIIRIGDREAFETCHLLARSEGMMVGGSSGLNVRGALTLAAQLEGPATIVTVLVDSGLKYMSKVFNEAWLEEHVYAKEAEPAS